MKSKIFSIYKFILFILSLKINYQFKKQITILTNNHIAINFILNIYHREGKYYEQKRIKTRRESS